MKPGAIDYIILATYFLYVLGIGWLVKRRVKTGVQFLTSGHSIPVWVTSLAFIATNLGAQEVIGMVASGAKYGMLTCNFYWLGAIPGMIILGVFMMPFYYGSRARSAPEYLKLRFDEKTRGFNAITFAVMTIFSSGISMYVLGLLFQMVLGWSFTNSVLLSAAIVLVYTYLGGLTSAIYNEVLQFFLIVLGFAPLSIMAVVKAGGWAGVMSRASAWMAGQPAFAHNPDVMTHTWKYMGHASSNMMGVEWFGMLFGLGWVLGCSYWCCNFLVVQRAMAAQSMAASRLTPLIAAFPKMLMPVIVIVPGIAAIALHQMNVPGIMVAKGATFNYNLVLTNLMAQFYPSGLLGVGLTALFASFMSGMAGNVTAFNTVFTYDIYQSYIKKNASDAHYFKVGRITTVVGVLLSIGAAYWAAQSNNIMDFLQLVFGFVNAPLFATFLLGMFWRRTTGHGAFVGLVVGEIVATLTLGFSAAEGAGGWFGAIHTFPSAMAQNFWIAILAFTSCLVFTVLVSVITKPKPVGELENLVYGYTTIPAEQRVPWYKRPVLLAVIVGTACILFNLWFW
ncbi:MAG: sodium:solute symporter family protein [Bryobacteraceae bacterium]|jgi:SSS family solute:Na+ symporter